MIVPTIGRVVWVWSSPGQRQPFAGLITAVHSDRCVNVVYWNDGGTQCSQTSATFVRDGDVKPWNLYAEWPATV